MQKHGKPETEASTPQKTVRVLDEAGNEYEATYPKRAKGLVKHGRARFTDESQTAILLTCPPNHDMNLEDNTMNEQINHTDIPDTSDLSDLSELSNLSDLSELTNNPLTAKEVFDQIAALQKQMMDQSYNALYRMTEAINDICGDDTFEADECREGAISRVTEVFMAREENYKRLLSTYEKMYSNLVSHNNEYREDRREFLKWITSCVASAQPGVLLPDFDKIWQAIR